MKTITIIMKKVEKINGNYSMLTQIIAAFFLKNEKTIYIYIYKIAKMMHVCVCVCNSKDGAS